MDSVVVVVVAVAADVYARCRVIVVVAAVVYHCAW